MTTRHKAAALLRGAKRTAMIAEKVECALATIAHEIAENGGIYPSNGGVVSKDEIARRAGIGENTLYAPAQHATWKRVDDWLDELMPPNSEEDHPVSQARTSSQRAAAWKARCRKLEEGRILVELELQQAKAEREEALANASQLRRQVTALQEQLRQTNLSNVFAIPSPDRT